MIAILVVYRCRNCDSQNIIKNGHNASGSQQYVCKDCGKRGVLETENVVTPRRKRNRFCLLIMNDQSLRGVEHTFGVSRPTLVSC